MDVDLCPGAPPTILMGDILRPKRHATPRIPMDGCRLALCSWLIQFVIIEWFSSQCASNFSRGFLYKLDAQNLSSVCWWIGSRSRHSASEFSSGDKINTQDENSSLSPELFSRPASDASQSDGPRQALPSFSTTRRPLLQTKRTGSRR